MDKSIVWALCTDHPEACQSLIIRQQDTIIIMMIAHGEEDNEEDVGCSAIVGRRRESGRDDWMINDWWGFC